jgi:hypothetical protein
VLVAYSVQIFPIVRDNLAYNWWPAYDTYAYEMAAQHVVHGEASSTQPALIYTMGAYKYPPIFAQLMMPIAFMPERPVDWAWRISACCACGTCAARGS